MDVRGASRSSSGKDHPDDSALARISNATINKNHLVLRSRDFSVARQSSRTRKCDQEADETETRKNNGET